MDIVDAYLRTSQQSEDLVRSVSGEHWHDATPCLGWDVRALCNHIHVGDIVIASRISDTPLPDPKSREDRLGDDPVAVLVSGFAELRRLLAESAGDLAKATITVGPHGDVHDAVVGELLAKRVADMVVHNWDLAKALGRPTGDFNADLVAFTLRHFEARTADDRSHNHIALSESPLPVPDRASDADRMAALLGRDASFRPKPFDRREHLGSDEAGWSPWDKAGA